MRVFHRSIRTYSRLTLLAAWTAAAPLLAGKPVWYSLQEIPLPPDATGMLPSELSNSGQVVGTLIRNADVAAFSYQNGSLILLTAPAGHAIIGATAVNDAGQIVGSVSDAGIPKSAYWAFAGDTHPTVLDSSGGPDANVYATGINHAGVICGYYTGSGSGNTASWRAVTWTPDGDRLRQNVMSTGVTPLPPGVFHAAYGINDSGQVVGTGAWIDPALITSQAAILWDANEQAHELAVLTGLDGAPRMHAYAINAAGVAVGVHVGHDGVSRGVRWNVAGAVTDLGLPAGFSGSEARDINAAGVIVGTLFGAASAPAMHDGDSWIDLRTRVINPGDGVFGGAIAVNDAGQILVSTLRNGLTYASVLTPAPLPGDVDGDGHVNLSDLGVVLAAYGFCVGDAGYAAVADFDTNGCVDLSDLGVVLSNFGK